MHELVRATQHRLGTPVDEVYFEDANAAMGQVVRMDATAPRNVYLPPIEPGDVGKTVVVVQEGLGTSALTIVAGEDDTINGDDSLAINGVGANAILKVVSGDRWARVGGTTPTYRYYVVGGGGPYSASVGAYGGPVRIDRIAIGVEAQALTKMRAIFEAKCTGAYSQVGYVKYQFSNSGGIVSDEVRINTALYNTYTAEVTVPAYSSAEFAIIHWYLKVANAGDIVSLQYCESFACVE